MPLDHASPDGVTIDLALARVPAGGEARGSIFVNLGGPGGSAIDSLRTGFRLDSDTMERYHLIGFDPRGVGRSSPLSCQADLTSAPRPDLSPDDDGEREALDTDARSLAESCGRSDGPLLPHLGTDSVVADLDLLRQAVGDPVLHYMGLSYGTIIGLRYAERHPELVGRMVLDGVVDPSFDLPDLLRQQAVEFERAFLVLDAACQALPDCPPGGIAASYDRLMADIEETGPRGGVGPTEVQVATLVSMYSEQLWPRLAAALTAAESGDVSLLEALHDLYVSGASFTAYLAVSCVDSNVPRGGPAWDGLAAELSDVAPRFGAALANEVRGCAHWPVPATGEPGPVTAPGSNPILIVTTTGDAPTPLVNAANVAATLAAAGLVIANDEGHTAYGSSSCVQRIVEAYFDNGEVPDRVHRC